MMFAQDDIIDIDGLAVHVTRKRVKNINLRIKPPAADVVVSAPFFTSDASIKRFVREKRSWVDRKREAVLATPRFSEELPSQEEVALWRREVESAVPGLIVKWEAIVGVKAGKVAYRNMTSRWGSCNPKTGRICINIQLARYPAECLEYVVVHELCHLLERGHGKRFQDLMDRFLPDWRARRKQLR